LQARGSAVQPASTVARPLSPAGREAMNNPAAGTY
jgi:hypothetical protein